MSIEAVVCDVWVPAEPEAAFRRFTAELVEWWPRSTHSVSEARCASVAMEGWLGGRLYETDEEGSEHEWGRITVWEPPRRFVTSWHPGRPESQAQEVEVTFSPDRGGTRVELSHRGWEAIGDEALIVRGRYAGGWSGVLATYAGSLGGDREA